MANRADEALDLIGEVVYDLESRVEVLEGALQNCADQMSQCLKLLEGDKEFKNVLDNAYYVLSQGETI